MLILGISSLDKDTTATLMKDGKIIYAVQEERLTRKKHQGGFPHNSINMIFDRTGITPKNIDVVAYPFFSWWHEAFLILKGYILNNIENLFLPGSLYEKWRHFLSYSKWVVESIRDHFKYYRELVRELKRLGLFRKLRRVDHHLSHSACAYMVSGFDRCLAVSLDWYGSGLAGNICIGEHGKLKRVFKLQFPHSLGMFYAQVTSALGFRPSSHEGKIVGLAAFGDPKVLGERLRKKFLLGPGWFKYISGANMRFSAGLAKSYPREHVAAAYQIVLEEVACHWLSYYVKKFGINHIALAGGVAANVKMNQRIAEIEGVQKVFVYPSMGDQGTGSGAAFFLFLKHGVSPYSLHDVYFGPDYTDKEIEEALAGNGLSWEKKENIEEAVGKLLAENKVIGVFNGRMEYGPRALGNRSILYHARDASVNDWLNKQLARTEFMPFAPAVLDGYQHQCFKQVEKAEHSAEFMTITFDCTDDMKKRCPAAVHVDGTGRPQIVRRDRNPSFYKILEIYYKMTGLPCVVNTSFNMHEEPIVCSPNDAIRVFLLGHLDYLAIGSYLVAQSRLT